MRALTSPGATVAPTLVGVAVLWAWLTVHPLGFSGRGLEGLVLMLLGTATSLWNTRSRTLAATDLVLTDDNGAATSVTLSYTRQASGAFGPVTGGFSNLGTSVLRTDTTFRDTSPRRR